LPETLVTLGQITPAEIEEITGGLMNQPVDVRLNKMVFEYDQIIICGPTFPHEVVGFSGGNKYFFPGIGGPEVINFSHWLGAVITSYEVIGTKHTPVRRVIDKAAAFIDKPKLCFSMVVKGDAWRLYIGSAGRKPRGCHDLSAKLHITWIDRPYRRVLSVMPHMYDDIWTAAKGMYKMEPAIADGGEVVIYAPHIDEISYTHGKLLDEVGYHVRDYFLKQWDKFKHYPGGVLATAPTCEASANTMPPPASSRPASMSLWLPASRRSAAANFAWVISTRTALIWMIGVVERLKVFYWCRRRVSGCIELNRMAVEWVSK
jgi:nickel-dependent lactate racemase